MDETTSSPTPTPSSVTGRLASQVYRYELTLSDYWRILMKRRWVVVATFVITLIATIIYTNTKTPLYQATSIVRITARPRAFAYGGGDMFMSNFMNVVASYENMITSEEVLGRVVIRLNLLSPQADAEDLTNKVADLRSAIKTDSDNMTGTIRIDVTYPNPELAAAIANNTADAFAEVDLLEKTRQARNLRQFIESQLMIFTQKLRDTENQMKQFRESGNALGIAAGMEQQLSDLERERSTLLKLYTEKHPDVVKLNARIEKIQSQLRELPENEVELARLQRELEINDRAYRMMKERYETARLVEAEKVSDVSLVQAAAVPEDPILPKKNLNKLAGAFIGIVFGIILAFVQENLDTSIGTIEDVEHIIRLPVIGIVPHYDPNRQEVPWWRWDYYLFNFLTRRAALPPEPAYLIMNQEASSTLAEAYRILRTFVQFLMEGKGSSEGGKVIMLTSTGPQEGKTLTSCNLAISLAQSGKRTLLMDADLRRPTVHRLFGLKRDPGLADVLLGMNNFNEARRTLGDILVGETSQWDKLLTAKLLDRLEVLTTGISTTTPAELISSENMKNLIREIRQQYDYILIDTPPVLPVTDSRTVGAMADATFFVYRSGKTARRALTRAKEELNLAGVQVKGIILNQATPEVTLTDQYYYQYYGEKGKKQPTQTTLPGPTT